MQVVSYINEFGCFFSIYICTPVFVRCVKTNPALPAARAAPTLVQKACINRASKLPQHSSNKAKKKKLAKQANKANNIRLDKKKKGSQKKKLRNNKNIEWD